MEVFAFAVRDHQVWKMQILAMMQLVFWGKLSSAVALFMALPKNIFVVGSDLELSFWNVSPVRVSWLCWRLSCKHNESSS